MSKKKDWKDPKDYLIEAYTNKLINDYKQDDEKEQERQRQRALSSPTTSNSTNSPTFSQNSPQTSSKVSQSTPAERDLFKITGRRHTVTDRRRGRDKNEKTQRTANISGQNRGLSRDDNDRFTNTIKGAGKQWLGGQLSGIGTTAQADIVNINSIRGARAEKDNDYRLTSREEADKREAESVNKSRTKDGVNLRDMERRYSLDPVGNVSDNYRKIVKGTQNIINKGDSLIESGTQDIEKAKEGATDFEKFLIDNGAQLTQWAGDASLRLIPVVGRALSMGGFFNRAGGMSAYQGRQEGMNPDQQFKYYAGSGLMEVLSELTFQSVGALRATYGKGMFSIADKLTTKASTSGIVNRLLNNTELGKSLFINMARLGGNAVEEGLEEVETDLVDPLLKYYIKKSEDPRAEFEGWDLKQMGYDFLMGATMGGVLGVAEVPSRVKYELNIANDDAFNDGMVTSLIKQASVQGRQSDGGRLIPTNAELLAQQLQQQMDNNIPVQPAQIRMLQEAIGQSISENQKQLTRRMTEEYDKAQKSGDLVQMEGTRLESQGIDNASVKLYDDATEKARQVLGEDATQEEVEAVAGVTTGLASTNEIDTVLVKPELKKAVETIVNEGADAESAVSIPVNNAEARDTLENLTAVKRIANRNTILKDVQAKNAEIIKSSVDNMSEGGKNLFASRAEFAQDTIGGNRDRNLEIYRDRFSRLYTDGNTKGADFETSYKRIIGSLDSEALKSVFTKDFARQIFEEGRNAIVTDTAKETAKSRAEEYANRKGGLTFENNNENLISSREREELQKFAERVGVEINVVKTLAKDASVKALMSRTGKKPVVNGKYKDGVITIASDAQNKLITVAKHELTHHLKETSPEMYQKLEDFVFERWYHGNAEEMEDEIARYTKLYSGQGLDRDGVREEIIADASEAFFTDEGAIQDAISFSEKLGRAIHDGIKTMLDAFLGLQDADSRRMRGYGGFLKDLGILQEAERMWLEALEDTQQRKRNARGGATAEDYVDASTQYTTSDEKHSLVESDDEIERLNSEPTQKSYRAMALIDGKLYPPMATRVKDGNGKWVLQQGADIGQWIKSDITTDHRMFNSKGQFLLKKDNGGSPLEVAYNPYIHSSDVMLNDQFASAHKRPNIVVVEGEIPRSELENGKRAEHDLDDGRHIKAKDPTGTVQWKAGVVQSHLTGTRTVFLTNHFKPTRVVPDSEVARSIQKMVAGTDVVIPYNVVTPSLRQELQKLGVKMEQSKQKGYQVDLAKYSVTDEDFIVKDGKARWTDERIDDLIRRFGAKGDEEYSKAYAVLMNPRDYLRLTLKDSMLQEWLEDTKNVPEEYRGMPYREARKSLYEKWKNTGEYINNENLPLDRDALKGEPLPPRLEINFYEKHGAKVHGHEGRHRMRALMEAGVKSVPVVLYDGKKYGKTNGEAIELLAQDFGDGAVNNGATVEIFDAIPIKQSNRDELIQKFGGEADVKFSVTAEDQAYMDAVNRGDMETAQRMVDEEAKIRGYALKAYHGTKSEPFNVFDRSRVSHGRMYGDGFYFSPYEDIAGLYGTDIREYYIKTGAVTGDDLDNETLAITEYKDIADKKEALDFYRSKVEQFKKYGQGIERFRPSSKTINGKHRITYTTVGVFDKGNILVVTEPQYIKSADPVTYDDNGNVIPLSERFNEGNEDIRYSISEDSDGNKLSEGQREYFKDSKVRDENGNLLKVYHGTGEEFYEFSRGQIGRHGSFEGAGFNFTPSEARATGYAYSTKEGKVLGGYLNITNPLSNDKVTFTANQLAKIIRDIDPTGDDIIANYAQETRDYGKPSFIERESLYTARQMLKFHDSDVDIYSDLSASGSNPDAIISAFQSMGYDGLIHYNPVWGNGKFGGDIKTLIAFDSNQFKLASNLNPTEDADIRYSLSSSFEAVGCDIRKENGLIKAYDGDGNEVKSFKPSDIRRSPLGRLLTLAVGRKILTEKDVNQQVDFLSRLYNMILNTQDPDLIWAVSGTIGYDPKHGIGKNTDWLKEAKSKFASITGNADPQYKTTIDFTTICVKTQAIIDAMSKVMIDLGRGLTEHEIIDIVYKETAMAGEQVPCPVCYVFSRWVGLGNLFGKIKEFQQDYPEDMDMTEVRKEYERIKKEADALVKEQTGKKSSGKAREQLYKETIERKDLLDLKDQMPNKKLTEAEKKELEDLNRRLEVLDHWSWLEKTRLADDYKAVPDDVLFDLNAGRTFATDYPATWRFRTTRGPALGKAVAPYSPSRLGDTIRGIASPSTLAKLGNSKRVFLNPNSLTSTARKAYDKAIANAKRQNRMNGQRLQSTSDFRFEYGLDYLLSFIELEAIGAKAQMYTKVPEAVKFLASTGTEVNCSIMAKGSGLDEKGNLIFSDITGMAWEDALMLSQMYDNVQPILVAIGREHLIKAMAHKAITMIIPYHASGSSESRYRSMMEAVGEAVEDRTDFAEYENEHDRDDATPEQKLCRKLRMDILTGKYANKELDTKERTALKNNDILRQLYIRIYGKDINGNPAKPNRKYVENYDKDGNDADCYGVYLTKEQAGVMMPYEYWDKHSTIKDADKQGETYIKYCESLGITPVFSGWDSKGKYDADMDFSSYTGYWKTLIDRCMYNNDGTYHKQQAVNVRNVDLDMLDSDEMKKGIFKPMQSQNAEMTQTIAERAEAVIAQEAQTSKFSVSDDEVLDRYIVDRQKRIDDGEQMSFFGSLNETLPSKPKEKPISEQFYDDVIKVINEIRKQGAWSGKEITHLLDEVVGYQDFKFIERLNDKDDDTAETDFANFLTYFTDEDMLRGYNWYFSKYRYDKYWKTAFRSGKMKFNKLIDNRIEEIKAGKAHGRSANIEKKYYTPKEMRKLFNDLNTDKELKELGKKVFDCIEKNFNVRYQGVANIKGFKHGEGGTLGQAGGRTVHLNMKYFNSEAYTDQQKASTLLHESIHSVTVYAMNLYHGDDPYTLSFEMRQACEALDEVYDTIKYDRDFAGQYGLKNAKEMVAELSNPVFRSKLKAKNLYERIMDSIKRLLGIKTSDGKMSAYTAVNNALETILNNADAYNFEKYARRVTIQSDGKFSVSEEDENAPTPKEYQSTIAKLEEKVADLKSEFKRTDLKTADPKQTRIQAGRLLKRHDSNLAIQDDVIDAFSKIHRLYKEKGLDAFDEASQIALETAKQVVDGIAIIHDEGMEQQKEIREFLKGNEIIISPYIEKNMDDFASFRKKNAFRLKLKKGEVSNLDKYIYPRLQELFPTAFPDEYYKANNKEGGENTDVLVDMLRHIGDVLDNPMYTVETITESTPEWKEYVSDIASDIMETAYGLQTKKTFADKKYLEKQKAVQEAYRKAREEALASRDRALAKQAERYETKISYLKQRNKDFKEETRERAEKKRRIAQIAGIHKRLLEKLDNPKDTKHLPDGYAPIVSNVLSMFDFTTEGMEKWAERYGEPSKRYRYLDELRKRLADMSKEDSPIAESGFEIDPDVIEIIEELKADVADTDRLSDLDSATLEDIYTLFKAFEHQLNTFNKAFDENNRQTVIENRDNFISDVRDKKTRKDRQGTIGWLQRQLETNNTTPEDFFHLIGGTPEKLYKSIRKGFDKHILNVKSAMDFIKATTEGKDVKKWSENVREYTTSFNETIKLTDAQLMSIYCLSKREQAQQHMYSENGGSGIVVVPQKVGKGLKAETLDRSNVVVNSSDIQKWISQLSKEQIEVADRLQRYLSEDMSKLGNETSLKLYGYKKFTEKNYFPIQSSNDWLNSNFDFKGDSPVLKNTGMTKALNKHASNPIVIDDIFTVATKHISTMSLYNSLVPSLTDFQRFWNSKDKDHNTTVQKEFIRVYGEPAYKYVENFMGDLNGAYKRGFEVEGVDKLMSKYKQASIGLNLRVLFQQPTAVARAGAVMNPIYITKALGASTTTLKQNLKDMREHCPIALWKSWGFYNTDLARDMRSIMMNEKTLSDNFSKAYGIADDLTWSVIFKAVRYEVEAQNKNLEVGSDEYWEKVNERASEVFDRTQVVDSPFHRSQNMRAKDNLSKMVTAFMAEPTKTYNMLKTELTLAKREIQSGQKAQGVKRATRVVQVFVTNAVLVSASSAVIDALRGVGGSGDDDKDKNWFERFLAHWWTNTKDNINPLGLLPVFKDVQSVVQGYDVTRMDMQAIGRMVKSLQYMGEYIKEPENSKYTFKNEAHYLLQQSAYLVGLPLANLERDTRGVALSIAEAVGYDDLFFEEAKFKYQVNDKTKSMWADMYLDAKYKGNTALAKKIKDYITSNDAVTEEYIEEREKKYKKENKSASQAQAYDSSIQTLETSPIWNTASEDNKEYYTGVLENISVGIENQSTEYVTKLAKNGLTNEQVILYKLALKKVDKPNKNGKLGGTPTNAEKEDAIRLLERYYNLTQAQKDILMGK